MENRSHIVAALIFILILGGGVVGFFFWLSSGDNATRTVVIDTTQSVGGISGQSPVKFKGLKVGHIEDVRFDPRDPNQIRITFKVRDSVPLTGSSYAELTTQGITGLSTLTLKTPKPSAPPLKGSPPRLPLHQGLLDKLKSRGQADLAKISTILDQVQKLTGGDNAEHLSQTFAQLDQVTRQLTQTQQALRPTIKQLPELTDQLRHTVIQIDQLARQAQKTAQSAQDMGQSGQAMMRNLNRRILPHIDTLTQQMSNASRQIQDLGAELSAKPQSVLLGPPKRRAGPGEPGFNPSDQ